MKRGVTRNIVGPNTIATFRSEDPGSEARPRGARAAIGPIALATSLAMAIVVPAAEAARAGSVSCGTVITESITLTADVGPCAEDGLIIGASGVTVDLDGHQVLGTYDPFPRSPADEEGITFRGVHDSTVTDGTVTHFSTGIIIVGGSENRVTRMNVHDNIGQPAAGDGVAIYTSDGNRVDHNRVAHNGPASGITVLGEFQTGSHHNEVSDNVVVDNDLPELNGAGGPDWKRDVGIAIEGPGATHNQILRNRITGSGLHGINVFPTCSTGYDITTGCPGTVPNDYNVIRGNVVNGNGFGEPLESAPVGDGIQILAKGPRPVQMAGHNIVEGNTANGNMRNGITLGGGNGQELTNETWTLGGESYGCFRPQGGDPDNPIVDSPDLCGVNDNTVTHNTASGNGSVGIYIGPRSDRNDVTHNTTNDNKRDGIAIGLAVRYDSEQNPVRDANGELVLIDGSEGHGNTLEHNSATGNGRWDGSDAVAGCPFNSWSHNLFAVVNQPCVD